MKDKVKIIFEKSLLEAEENLEQDCDIFGLKFESFDKKELEIFDKIYPKISKPLMIRYSKNNDIKYLFEIISKLDRECIIGIVNENNYKEFVPLIIKGNHTAVIRTPIDINLAKEMNILTGDMGLEKILIDTDIGGLGYGFEYGYSIMEKIKLEGVNGDKYLDKPIISFAADETSKTKEAIDNPIFLEISAVSAVIAAGADYVVVNYPETVKTLRNML